MKNRLAVLLLSVVFVALGAPLSHALPLDLTTAGASGYINDAFFQQIAPKATGTGVINSFVQVGANTNVTQAYNTTVNGVLNNGSSDVFNHALLLSDVPVVNLGGKNYRQFFLDINQNSAHPLLSLDEIQIFQSSAANQSVTTFSSGILNLASSNLVYQLDALGDTYIKMDYSLNHGSGSGDMFAYILDSKFTSSDPYVYLYSKFGQNYANNAGFEEWATLKKKTDGGGGGTSVVPEPATMALFAPALLGMIVRRKKMA